MRDIRPTAVGFPAEYQVRPLIERGLRPHPDFPDVEECITDYGRVDLFCQDATGLPVVIELKATDISDHAIGQVARYMAWAKEAYPTAKNVRGMPLAPTVTWKGVKGVQTVIPGLETLPLR